MCDDQDYESSAMLIALPSFGQPPNLNASPYIMSPQYSFPAEEEGINENFVFSLLIRDCETHPSIAADKIFTDGYILPIYPVLHNASAALWEKPKQPQLLQLLMEEQDWSKSETSSSYAVELEGIPPVTYCLWSPAQSLGSVSKCCSTGSLFVWRISDLVLGWRISDGKKAFFLAAEEKRSTEKKVDAEGGNNNGQKFKRSRLWAPPPAAGPHASFEHAARTFRDSAARSLLIFFF